MATIALDALPGFTFGCDPELFVVDQNDRFVSAEGLLPGTKEDPYKVNGGAVQVDGMAAEFNIDPVTNFDDFNNNITKVLLKLKTMLPRGHKLVGLPSVEFSKEVWDKTPDIAKILGCSPDFNAWTGKVNPPPNPEKASSPRLRTASGHLHIGWTDDADISDKQYVTNCRDLVKQLDWYLGSWSVTQDNDPTRRELYGQAGAMRFKPYGVEYRVLSNFWVLRATSRLAVWNRLQQAINDMRERFMPENAPHVFNELVVKSINESKMDDNLSSNFPFPIRKI